MKRVEMCRASGILIVAVLLGCAAGCAQSPTSLPDPATMPTRTSADADRERHQREMSETQSAANSRQGSAIEKIQGTQ